MRIVIIGAGLSGCVAYGAFMSHNPTVLESAPESGFNKHFAVMRFKSPDIAAYLGAQAVPITIRKSVYYHTKQYDWCPPDMLNMYSLKVHGNLSRRSIIDVGESERYTIKKFTPSKGVLYNKPVVEITKKHIHCSDGSCYPYDVCISTIPLFVTAKNICGQTDFDCSYYKSTPITVIRARLAVESSVHLTTYYPEPGYNVYRATIEGQDIIVEMIGDTNNGDESYAKNTLYWVLYSFGLEVKHVVQDSLTVNVQKYGKIYCTNEDHRHGTIMSLTEEHMIFSFGRFAVWEQIRADDLVEDIKYIWRMVDTSEIWRKYNLTKVRANEG